MPALLTSTSILPASASTFSTPALTDASSLTSSSTVLTPSFRRASAASRFLPGTPRMDAYTVWPAQCRVSAVSRPKPLLAPVIRIVFDMLGVLELHAARVAASAITASRMTPATMSGCDSIKKCDAPSTSVTVESARSYWKRWRSGATGRSAVPNTAQDGFVRQAAAVAGAADAEGGSERPWGARKAASAVGRAADEVSLD